MNKDKESFEKTYEKPGAVWTETKPHKELIKLTKTIKSGKVLDIGCGEDFIQFILHLKNLKWLELIFQKKQ